MAAIMLSIAGNKTTVTLFSICSINEKEFYLVRVLHRVHKDKGGFKIEGIAFLIDPYK